MSDLDRARTFYRDALGLDLLWENPASMRFGIGSSELSVFRRPGLELQHTVAHFEVTDIAAAVAELEAAGVTFVDYDDGPLKTTGHVARIGPALGAWFRDPDGNFLGLRQAD
ncbi:MAG TPA: VOC family protein [Candidatus Limnocylindrales bacterium]